MRRYILKLAALALMTGLYFGAGELGLSLACLNRQASAVWPPTGLALAALLLLGNWVWPSILLGAFLVNWDKSGQITTSSFIAIGNLLEALVGAALVRRFAGGRSAFDEADKIFRYTFLAAAPSCAVSATIGIATLLFAGHEQLRNAAAVWFTWWLGDFVSDLLIAPLIVIWAVQRPPRLSRAAALEAGLLLAPDLLIALAIFGPWLSVSTSNYPTAYFLLPVLVWTAYRFHQLGAITISFITSVIALWGTLHGWGPFARGGQNSSLVLLEAFIGIATTTKLVLASLVAERQRVESALRDAEAQSRAVLESAVDGIITIDERGTIESVNPAAQRMFGYSVEALIGQNLKMLMPSPYRDQHDSFLKGYLDTGVRKVIGIGREVSGRRKDGSTFPIDLAVSEIRLGNRRIFTGVLHDITDHKRAQKERDELLERERIARAEAERASHAKDQFLAVLSHELRTPLTPVMLIASLLENADNVPESVRADLRTIRRNVELEARLIDDLLDLTRIARGKMQLNLQPADVHPLILQAIKICSAERGPRLEVELKAQQHHVRADPARMQQVFWNLLSNAQKFTPPDGIIRVRSHNDDIGQLIVEVSDTGAGIEPQMLPRLFTAFEQGDAARVGKTGGLGLGLAISHALVSAHGGEIRASSEGKGRGTTFTVRLPTVPQPTSATTPGGNGDNIQPPPLRSLRILLVEDNPDALAALTKLLKMRSHQVTTATTLSRALELGGSQQFDLLISDLGLPDGTGYDLMRSIRQRHDLIGIAVSGYGMDSDIRRSLEAGFAEHLIKPVDLTKLEAAMARAMS